MGKVEGLQGEEDGKEVGLVEAVEEDVKGVESWEMMNAECEGRAGGVYIPPAKRMALERMRSAAAAVGDVRQEEDVKQRANWEKLRRNLNALVNKASIYNIKDIMLETFKFNLVRGRGLLCNSLMRSQLASPAFTPVYAAMVAVINTKIPDIGELIIARLIFQFRKAYRRNDKATLLAVCRFIAHLANQLVCGLVVPFQILILLLNVPTYNSIEIATSFVTEMGALLSEVSPKSLSDVFDRFRAILNEGDVDKRVEYLIENAFANRKKKFQDNPAIRPELDLVEEGDQVTHDRFSLDEDDADSLKIDIQEGLNYYQFDPDFQEHESKYDLMKREILDLSDEEDGEDEDEKPQPVEIQDMTGEEINKWKRSIYLIQMSSLDHEEAAHKLVQAGILVGEESILCNMIVQCCAEERTYLKFYALVAQRLCLLEYRFQVKFEQLFEETYMTSHRLESNSIRNVSQLFAHLFFTDAIAWRVFECVRLNIRDTNASRRIFIQILFNTIAEYLGLKRLSQRLAHPDLIPHLNGLFPIDNPGDTKWAINYWTAIGLEALTVELRDHYRRAIEKITSNRPTSHDHSSQSSSSYSSDYSYSSDECSSKSWSSDR